MFRLFGIREKKIFFIATHDESDEGNLGLVAERVRREMPEYALRFMTKRDGICRPVSFFFLRAYHMATAGTIFLDNVFMPMAYTPISKRVKVVQLWHGTGTIKKFGQDSDTGEVARISKKADARITHLIVNSEKTREQYAGAFALPRERVHVLGLPRTDLILDKERMEEKRARFFRQYPELAGKRITLYAPTFRDDEEEHPRQTLDLGSLTGVMGEDEALFLRLHPHVAAHFPDEWLRGCEGRVYNMSDYPGVTTLLAVSDRLITDYSSVVYEYALLGRPMIFYAYDLEKFEKEGRSFYEPYEETVPGPVVRSQRELERLWGQDFAYRDRLEAFIRQNYEFLDKGAINRLLKLIFGIK